ncbi:sugar ABC transporter substrate-binding protein [Agromyces bauzanensis]
MKFTASQRATRTALVLGALLATSITLTACGSGGSSTAAAGAGSSAELTAFTEQAQAAVDAASAPQTPETAPVPTGGPTPQAGVELTIIPCSMAVEGCARPARSAEEAAKALGWKPTIDDPSTGQGGASAAVQRAVATGADAILLTSIDAGSVKADLQAARDKGIVVVANMAGNADDLYQAIVPPLEANFDAGYLLGQQAFLIAQERYQQPVKAIVFEDQEFATVKQRVAGFVQFVQDCADAGGGCSIEYQGKHLAADIATTLPNQVVQTVKQHPDYNTLFLGFDAALNAVVTQGLLPAGLADPSKAQGVSVDCDVANATSIAEGGFQSACIGFAFLRAGYGHVDNINRLIGGQEAVDQGLVGKLITEANAPTDGEAWDGDFDAVAEYRKAWGLD